MTDDRDENDGRYVFSGYNDNMIDEYSLMNSKLYADGAFTKEYQFGVYTYLYTDLPIISGFIRIPFFSKTRKMYEFRNINTYSYSDDNLYKDYDYDLLPKDMIDGNSIISVVSSYPAHLQSNYIDGYSLESDFNYGLKPGPTSYLQTDSSKRELYKYYIGPGDMKHLGHFQMYGNYLCGHSYDWSAY